MRYSNMEENRGGAPSLTTEELETIVSKLEPHLKGGKSLRRACLEAQIPHASVYRYYDKLEWFRDKIDVAIAYPANLINDLFFGRLVSIATKQNKMHESLANLKAGKIKKEDFDKLQAEYEISDQEWKFIEWYAITSYSTRDDYGQRIDHTERNPRPFVPETSTREVAELMQALLHKDNAAELLTMSMTSFIIPSVNN